MLMDRPLVSVIMATKDTEPYLPDCLDSIISQSYEKWELIAVNDHSSDRTPEILRRYAQRDPRIRVSHSSQHLLIPALQEGYKHVTGQLLNRMDSDDKMPDYKLQVLVEEWLKYGKGTVIAGGTKHFVDEGEVGDGFRRYENWLNQVARKGTHREEIYTECVIPSHSWIMHLEDFERIGAFESGVYPEDYDLCFRIYKHGLNIVGIDKVLHYWRDRSDRISRTWDCYKDNRYFGLKLRFFYELDRDPKRPLVLWGAGTNGKDMLKLLLKKGEKIHWVCDNWKKIGKHAHGILMNHYNSIPALDHPQVMIVVASEDDKRKIKSQMNSWCKKPVIDYWFFL